MILVCHILLVQKLKECLGGACENANAINPGDICSIINHTIEWIGKTEWDRFEVSLTYITFTHTSAIYSIVSSLSIIRLLLSLHSYIKLCYHIFIVQSFCKHLILKMLCEFILNSK